MKFLLILCYSLLSNFVFSQQKKLTIQFIPTFSSKSIELNKLYNYKGESLEISTLKFYVSNIKFYDDNILVDKVLKKHHLIDADNQESYHIKHLRNSTKGFSHLEFEIGIDSLTNVSGAMGEDLDPINGMYWTWQNGYINFKLEGKSNLLNTRNHNFIFHIGGYQAPFGTIQKLNLKVSQTENISIEVDIASLLNQINLNEYNEIMSPSTKAVVLAKKIAGIFKTCAE